MKIGFLTHDVHPYSGWGRYSWDLISEIKAAGHEVVILTETGDSEGSVPVLYSGGGIMRSAWTAARLLKDCDIIHALDGYPYGCIAALANFWLRKKLIINTVGTYSVEPLYNQKIAWLLRWAYRQADQLVSISEFTRAEVRKRLTLDNFSVIVPGIDLKAFTQPHQSSLPPYLLGVGALKSRKGYHISIPAFAQAKKQLPSLEYVIVGSQEDTAYFRQLQELCRLYQVQDAVRFESNINDQKLRALYQGATVFILASVNRGHQFEGLGLVFLEAAAAGLPVIGTLDNGIVDAVDNGQNGLLVPQNDIPGTADAIIALVGSEERQRAMSVASRHWVASHDRLQAAERYISLYRQLLAQTSVKS